jgi:recombination protein RecT
MSDTATADQNGIEAGKQLAEFSPEDAASRNKVSKIEAVRQSFDRMGDQFKLALPAHIPVERFVRVTMTALQSNPMLLDCDRRSLFASAMKCAQDGLLPDGRLAAFVPFKGQVQYLPMVAGILKKVRNSGELVSISSHIAYANDKFFYRLGDEEKIEHEPLLDGDRGEPKLVYAVAHTKDGGVYREIMTVAEIEKVRAVSRAGHSKEGPWVNWWDEMARKTVVRRLSKYLPMSTDLDDLIRRDDDLYDFEGARKKAEEVATPRATAIKQTLDSFAGKANTETQGSTQGGPGESASQKQSTESPSSQSVEGSAGAAAAGSASDAQSASHATKPDDLSRDHGRETAAAAETNKPKDDYKKTDGGSPEPRTEKDYLISCAAWIDALTDADAGEARWSKEKAIRNKAFVGSEAREALARKLEIKCTALRAPK